ncbi:MAG: class I SAM-dependent methyltransferase [Steroidobacteraceae bacterium]
MSARDDAEIGRHSANGSWEQAVATLLADPQQRPLARDCYFDGTAVEAGARYWASEEWRAVRSLLPEARGVALDVGAGRGIASYALARDGWKVRALEPDGSAIVGAAAIRGLAAATGYPIEVFEGFGEKLPFEAEQFDVVIARQSLHHARDLAALVRELHRVLRPGGRLVAIRDHVISHPADLARFYDAHPLHRLYGGERAYLLEEYTAAIRGAGFALLRIIAPLESPINYAPLTRETLAAGIAGRLPNVLNSRRIAAWLMRSRSIMAIALLVLKIFDNRPGRLYSFVAERDGA